MATPKWVQFTTCHWCHVMEHESFGDQEIAKLMNNAFISIKVDREERLEIDNIYDCMSSNYRVGRLAVNYFNDPR